MSLPSSFVTHVLSTGFVIYTGRVPDELVLTGEALDALWDLHPPDQPIVELQQKRMIAPRWHQAYGRDYSFAGFTSTALPVPPILQPFLDWSASTIDARINGILVNWYDAGHAHRIAQHKDSPISRIMGCPIATISMGASRTFLMHVGKRTVPFRVGSGDVVVIPDATNDRHAHSVPHLDGDSGRRISITLRGFSDDPALQKSRPTSAD
jgi:alkylated DNA repair dioxygenase AlkB